MDLVQSFRYRSALLAAASSALELIHHSGDRGRAREDLLQRFFEEILPDRIGIGKGEIWAAGERWSRQGDLIFYDKQNCPRLFSGASSQIFPIESCAGVLEVKSSLRPKDIRTASGNIASAKRLRSAGAGTVATLSSDRLMFHGTPPLLGAVFAFTRGVSPKTFGSAWLAAQNSLPFEQRIDLACIPGDVFIYNPGGSEVAAMDSGEDSLIGFTLELIRRVTATGFASPSLYQYAFPAGKYLEFKPYDFSRRGRNL